MRAVIISIIFLSAQVCFAQQINSPRKDSLQKKLRADSTYIFRRTFAKPFLKVENRNSFIHKEQVNLLGFQLGATFIGRHTLAAGYYFLDPRKKNSIVLRNGSINTNNYVELNYFTVVYQYVVFTSRFVQVNSPLGLGYGGYKIKVSDSLDQPVETRSGYIWPVNGGLQLIIKPIRWAGITGSGGYRFVAQQKNIELSLQGWYYTFGVWIDARQIIRSLRYHKKKRIYKKEIAIMEGRQN